MTAKPAPSKGNPMTPEVFGRFLEWLSPDHETAANQYLQIRRKLVLFFIRKGCAHSGELSDRTLDRMAYIVYNEPGKYSNAIALSYGVARNVCLEYLREVSPSPLETDNIPAPDPDDGDFREHEAECLSTCVGGLPQRERDLITQYHRFRGRQKIEARKRLAQEHGGANKLRITTHRIRVKLYKCIQECVQAKSH
jgi:hypothetical protein